MSYQEVKGKTITQGQKQALIDNLQLEITERARKLRAQYALQAQSLCTRAELRVNRIPTSLRKANMGELLLKYVETTKQDQNPKSNKPKTSNSTAIRAAAKPPAAKPVAEKKKTTWFASASSTRGTKRSSDALESTDKENVPDSNQPLLNPKKRTKVSANTVTRHAPNPNQPLSNPKTRAKASASVVIRQVHNSSTVLSPKSSNSRTMPKTATRSVATVPRKPPAATTRPKRGVAIIPAQPVTGGRVLRKRN